MQVRNMERQWGDLDRYRGINTSAKGAEPAAVMCFVWLQVFPGIRMLALCVHPRYLSFLLVAWMR